MPRVTLVSLDYPKAMGLPGTQIMDVSALYWRGEIMGKATHGR